MKSCSSRSGLRCSNRGAKIRPQPLGEAYNWRTVRNCLTKVFSKKTGELKISSEYVCPANPVARNADQSCGSSRAACPQFLDYITGVSRIEGCDPRKSERVRNTPICFRVTLKQGQIATRCTGTLPMTGQRGV